MKRALFVLFALAILTGCAAHRMEIKTRDDYMINMSKLDDATEQRSLE